MAIGMSHGRSIFPLAWSETKAIPAVDDHLTAGDNAGLLGRHELSFPLGAHCLRTRRIDSCESIPVPPRGTIETRPNAGPHPADRRHFSFEAIECGESQLGNEDARTASSDCGRSVGVDRQVAP